MGAARLAQELRPLGRPLVGVAASISPQDLRLSKACVAMVPLERTSESPGFPKSQKEKVCLQ